MKCVTITWSSGKQRVCAVEDVDSFLVSMFGSSRIPDDVTVKVDSEEEVPELFKDEDPPPVEGVKPPPAPAPKKK